MYYVETLVTFLAVLLSFSIVFISNIPAQSQSGKKKKSIDFGSSINRKKDKNKNDDKSSTNQIPSEIVDDVIRIETNLVRSDVLVMNPKGNLILGLEAKDFIVTENGIEQKIGTFSIGNKAEVPRSIVLILDYSSSQNPYIKTSVEAAKLLVDKLNSQDKMAIVTDDVELLTPFTQDKTLLKKKLDFLHNKSKKGLTGKSQQYSALMAALNELFTDEDVRRIVIFQTDGDQLFFIKPETLKKQLPGGGYTTFTDRELIETVEKSRATIYSIYSGYSMLKISPEEQINRTELMRERLYANFKGVIPSLEEARDSLVRIQLAMKVIAEATGGYISMLEKPEDSDLIYSTIFKTIENRYLIGYYPTIQERDGKRRNVKIEVRAHPEFIVLGQKAYFADKPN